MRLGYVKADKLVPKKQGESFQWSDLFVVIATWLRCGTTLYLNVHSALTASPSPI